MSGTKLHHTLHQGFDYMEIDARRALERVGYVIVKMPDFDMEHLNACRDGKKGTQYNWLPILNQVYRSANKFYNARNINKRLEKHVVLSEEYIVQQYEKWRDRYNLGQLELYKVALLRSLPGCGRQYYHCDTLSVNTLKDEQFDDYHLGAVCAPWQKAKLHIK